MIYDVIFLAWVLCTLLVVEVVRFTYAHPGQYPNVPRGGTAWVLVAFLVAIAPIAATWLGGLMVQGMVEEVRRRAK